MPGELEVAPGVIVTRAFSAVEAASVVVVADRSTGWRDAGINANLEVDRALRDAEVLFEEANPKLIGFCRDRLYAATAAIARTAAPKTVLAEIQIVRYRAGGRYVSHRDTPALGETPRALSLVCYLNDDFTGGATTFAEPELVVSPQTGAVVVFSPLLLHQAQPVVSGTKYVITAWYHVPPS